MKRHRVLLIRPDGNETDAAELGRFGIETLIEPLLEVRPCDDPAPARLLATELASLGAADWLLITSPRTWGCWAQTVPGLGETLLVAAGRGVRVGCVGRATAASLPGLPPGAVHVSTGIGAEELLAWLLGFPQPAETRPTAVLPASSLARPLLAEGLRAAGWTVYSAGIYQTRPRRPAADSPIHDGGFDAVLVRSPSAASALHALGVGLDRATIFAIGPSSAARCRALGWPAVELTDTRPAQVAARVAADLGEPN